MAGKGHVATRSTPRKVADYGDRCHLKRSPPKCGEGLEDYKEANMCPDPSFIFTLQLSDETLPGNNLLAFQKDRFY